MKQIELAKLYAEKNVLIVNPHPEERTALKKHLLQCGANNIDMCANALEAIEHCEKLPYNMIISEHDLGSDKNGQQLIEELRFHKLLSNTAIYILLTDNTTIEQVLHTLEYQPDEYLRKPLSEEHIRQRLNHCVVKKHSLQAIYDALDEQNTQQAIQTCKQLLAVHDEYKLDILKQLSELYFQTHNIQDAKRTYLAVLKTKSPIWAKVGLAKCHYALNDIETAQHQAETIIDANPLCVNGFELLADILAQKHEKIQAQYLLNQAIKLTPNAYERQKKLAQISAELGDEHSAFHAYKAALKLAKNSYKETFEDSLSFSTICMQLSKHASSEQAKEYIQASKNAVAQAKKKYPNQLLIPLRAHLLNAEHQAFHGHTQASNEALQHAKSILPQLHNNTLFHADMNFCIECAQALISQGEYHAGEKLLLELASIHTDTKSAVQIDRYLREPLTKEGIQFAAKLNQEGIALYDQKKWHKASSHFKKVIQELPNHVGLNLNFVQALIAKAKIKPLSEQEWQDFDVSIKKINGMPLIGSHKKRLEYILRQKLKLKLPSLQT